MKPPTLVAQGACVSLLYFSPIFGVSLQLDDAHWGQRMSTAALGSRRLPHSLRVSEVWPAGTARGGSMLSSRSGSSIGTSLRGSGYCGHWVPRTGRCSKLISTTGTHLSEIPSRRFHSQLPGSCERFESNQLGRSRPRVTRRFMWGVVIECDQLFDQLITVIKAHYNETAFGDKVCLGQRTSFGRVQGHHSFEAVSTSLGRPSLGPNRHNISHVWDLVHRGHPQTQVEAPSKLVAGESQCHLGMFQAQLSCLPFHHLSE